MAGCSAGGASGGAKSLQVEANPHSRIGRVIGVMSGKGGVGKSTVTSMAAVALARKGYRCGILDADITGPTIPRAFGVRGKLTGTDVGVIPAQSATGIQMVSINLALAHEDDPVIYRGPIIAGTVKQFWSDVIWDVDYLFIDMPPGTGDVPLTIFQSLPVDGILVVTSPQDLVSMIVGKAVKMAKMMRIPVLGVLENYSYMLCPDCGKKLSVFGEGQTPAVCEKYEVPFLGQLPLDAGLASAMDAGNIEDRILPEAMQDVANMLEGLK